MKKVLGTFPVDFWKNFGPGLMWAAAAIGVSHLHQSTRAGATAGFGLVGVVALALILKYPFFEFGPRYAAATGKSLVEGYNRIGKWALWLYFVLTVFTSVIVQVAVILFTAFLFLYATGLDLPLWIAGGAVYWICAGILWVGRFKALDLVIKIVVALLGVSTLWAAFVSLPAADWSTLGVWPGVGNAPITSLAFILALAGWMPSAFDVAVWSSLWTVAKNRASGGRVSVKSALLDFNIGYAGTSILAFAFLLLGAAVMFQSGSDFSPQGTVFSTQLVDLYAQTLGGWMRPVVLVAVLTTMFSTALTVVDGFPRGLDRCFANFQWFQASTEKAGGVTGPGYLGSIMVLGVLNPLVLVLFIGNLATMIDFATIFTFITAPVLGYLNLRAVTSDEVAPEHRPGKVLLRLSYISLVILSGTSVVYVVSRLI
ncbi:MAG: divalent metal cation transporter [Gemmatimonadota bacterium]|nr:divalent metal cation transporter [Gemmatimonadota bacterium]MDH5803825.1 divalent metal cation transporter [Gemmatimonadota bacterium]